jgi:hypothetical protein
MALFSRCRGLLYYLFGGHRVYNFGTISVQHRDVVTFIDDIRNNPEIISLQNSMIVGDPRIHLVLLLKKYILSSEIRNMYPGHGPLNVYYVLVTQLKSGSELSLEEILKLDECNIPPGNPDNLDLPRLPYTELY